MFRRQFTRVACLSPFAVSFANAQSTTVSGWVYDPEKNGVPEADVVFSNPMRRLLFSTVTDRKGHFSMSDIPAGTYRAQAAAAGPQLTGEVPNVELPSSQEILILTRPRTEPGGGRGAGGGKGGGKAGPAG